MLQLQKNSKTQLLILDQLDKKIKFKRIFFLIANKNSQRGDHAHKKCIQAFFSVKGSFFLDCIFSNGKKKKIKIIQGKNLQIIEPKTWVKVNLNKNDICGVLCDSHFSESDYIREFTKFKKILKKNEKS